MLVLTRKTGEALKIGADGKITVTVLAVHGRRVQLGIEAPEDVSIHRHEIWVKIHPHAAADEPSPAQ